MLRLALAVLLVALAIAAAASLGAAAPGSRLGPVPVTPCRTEYGLPGQLKPPRVPKLMLATARQERDGQLGFYANGWLTVVAPSGWRCSGSVGATGALFMTVVPPQARLTHRLPSSRTRAVNVYVASPGTGEVGIACALFPNVRPKPNPCTLTPAREKAVRLGPHVVAFEDPAHVKGTGDPSGGLSPANGVMIYDGSKYPHWAAEETCTLPESQHRACTVILNDFVRRYHVEPMRFYSRGA